MDQNTIAAGGQKRKHSTVNQAVGSSGVSLPPIEGFGASSLGGSGGSTVHVTTAADSGAGSLRQALSASGARIIVFDVSGWITLDSPLVISNGRVTIDGYSAPGPGVGIRCKLNSAQALQSDSYGIFQIFADDVIIQGLSLRPGIWPNILACTAADALGPNTCRDPQDIITIYSSGAHRLVFDHLSMSHHTDLWFNLDNTQDVTIQYCIGAYGYSSYPCMGMGTTDDIGRGKGLENYGPNATNYSVHHNLWAHASCRMPQISGLWDDRYTTSYNWGINGTGFDAFGVNVHNIHGVTHANVVDLVCIPGPVTPPVGGGQARQFQVTDWRGLAGGGSAGDLGIYMENCPPVNKSTQAAVNWSSIEKFVPYSAPAITRGGGNADALYYGGAMWKREADGFYTPRRGAIDSQIVYEVQTRTGRAPIMDEAPAWDL